MAEDAAVPDTPGALFLRVARDGTFNALVSVKSAHFPLTESGLV